MDDMDKYQEPNQSLQKSKEKKHRHCIPQFPNFLTKVLFAIQTIRTTRGRGATLGEISNFLKRKFELTGDIRSRTVTGILQAEHDGFVIQRGGKYVLVVPLASMHNATTSKERRHAIRVMQEVFLFKPNLRMKPHSSDHRDVYSATTSDLNPVISQANLAAVLKQVEHVLVHLQAATNAHNSFEPREDDPPEDNEQYRHRCRCCKKKAENVGVQTLMNGVKRQTFKPGRPCKKNYTKQKTKMMKKNRKRCESTALSDF